MMKQKTLNIDRKTNPEVYLHLRGTQRNQDTRIMVAFLFGSWLMVVLWIVVSFVLFNYSWPWACLILFSTLAFGWYLRQVTTKLNSRKTKIYDLQLDADKIKLTVFDYKTGQLVEKTFLWSQIRWAEVYRYVDESSVVLQGWDKSIEIPLWAFGSRKRAVLKALMSKQISIVRIP